MEEKVWEELYNLLRGADKVVLGYAVDWYLAIKQHKKILAAVPLRLNKKILLDFSGNDFGDLTNSYPLKAQRIQYYYSK